MTYLIGTQTDHFVHVNDCLLIDIRMMQIGTIPDDESYNLVIGLLLSTNQLDPAVKYLDLMLKSGNMVSSKVFMDSILGCLNSGRLDTLCSIIQKCKVPTYG